MKIFLFVLENNWSRKIDAALRFGTLYNVCNIAVIPILKRINVTFIFYTNASTLSMNKSMAGGRFHGGVGDFMVVGGCGGFTWHIAFITNQCEGKCRLFFFSFLFLMCRWTKKPLYRCKKEFWLVMLDLEIVVISFLESINAGRVGWKHECMDGQTDRHIWPHCIALVLIWGNAEEIAVP